MSEESELAISALSSRDRDRLLGEVCDELRILARKILSAHRAGEPPRPSTGI